MHSEEVWNNLYNHAAKLFSKWRVNPQDLHDLAMDAVVKTLEQEIKSGVRLETMLHRAASKVFRVYAADRRLGRLLTTAARRGFMPAYKDRGVFSEKVFART